MWPASLLRLGTCYSGATILRLWRQQTAFAVGPGIVANIYGSLLNSNAPFVDVVVMVPAIPWLACLRANLPWNRFSPFSTTIRSLVYQIVSTAFGCFLSCFSFSSNLESYANRHCHQRHKRRLVSFLLSASVRCIYYVDDLGNSTSSGKSEVLWSRRLPSGLSN